MKMRIKIEPSLSEFVEDIFDDDTVFEVTFTHVDFRNGTGEITIKVLPE